MAQISKNQYDYLTNLSKGTGGNAAWAKSQLKGSTYTPPAPTVAPKPQSTPVPQPSSSNQTTYLNNLVAQGGGNAAWAKSQLNNIPKPPSSPVPAPQSPPMGGYTGGFTYGQDDPARSHSLDASRKVWQSDPAAKQAEIDRTLGVIDSMKGQDTSAQYKHLTQTLGYNPKVDAAPVPAPMPNAPAATSGGFSFTPSPNTPHIPAPQNTNPVMDRAAIQKYVADQIAAKLAQSRSAADQSIKAGETTAQQQLGAIQTQYDRTRQTIGEDRTLQNLAMDRNLNPFSGRTSFEKGITNLQRERSDREMSQDLATRQGNVNADLANFRNSIDAKYAALQEASGAEAERLQREILSDERQYELALRGENRSDVLANASLTDQDFRRQLDSFNANRGVYQDERDFDYQAGRDQLSDQLIQQQLQRGEIDQQTAQFNLDQLRDPNSPVNLKQQMDTELSKLKLQDYPKEQQLKIQEMQRRIAEIGKAPYRNPQDVEYDKLQVQKITQEIANLKNTAAETKPVKIEPKDSISVYNDIYEDVDNFDAVEKKARELGITAKQAARQLLEQNRDLLTDSDYKKLNDKINKEY